MVIWLKPVVKTLELTTYEYQSFLVFFYFISFLYKSDTAYDN